MRQVAHISALHLHEPRRSHKFLRPDQEDRAEDRRRARLVNGEVVGLEGEDGTSLLGGLHVLQVRYESLLEIVEVVLEDHGTDVGLGLDNVEVLSEFLDEDFMLGFFLYHTVTITIHM